MYLLDISCLLDKLFSSGNNMTGLQVYIGILLMMVTAAAFSGIGARHLYTYNNCFNDFYRVLECLIM